MSARIDRLLGIATLQGPPLTGYRRYGVPPGGAFDQESFQLANAMLRNPPEAMAIELSNAPVEITFRAATRVAVVGAPVILAISDNPTSGSSFGVPAGAQLRIDAPRQGLRTYLAVAGGWIPDGVDSPLARSGRSLSVGDILEHDEIAITEVVKRLAEPPSSLSPGPIRVIPVPHSGVPYSALAALVVSNNSDRTGIRLDGLCPMGLPELPSEPACVGAIQLTPSGQLIVIGPDGPTIGGYPKIAVVCSADLDRLAQLRPGQPVSFEWIKR